MQRFALFWRQDYSHGASHPPQTFSTTRSNNVMDDATPPLGLTVPSSIGGGLLGIPRIFDREVKSSFSFVPMLSKAVSWVRVESAKLTSLLKKPAVGPVDASKAFCHHEHITDVYNRFTGNSRVQLWLEIAPELVMTVGSSWPDLVPSSSPLVFFGFKLASELSGNYDWTNMGDLIFLGDDNIRMAPVAREQGHQLFSLSLARFKKLLDCEILEMQIGQTLVFFDQTHLDAMRDVVERIQSSARRTRMPYDRGLVAAPTLNLG